MAFRHRVQVLISYSSDLVSPIKKSLIADERRKPHVKTARRHGFSWTLLAIAQAAHRVVFIDETNVQTNMTRLRGRSQCGTRLKASTPFSTYSCGRLWFGGQVVEQDNGSSYCAFWMNRPDQ